MLKKFKLKSQLNYNIIIPWHHCLHLLLDHLPYRHLQLCGPLLSMSVFICLWQPMLCSSACSILERAVSIVVIALSLREVLMCGA